MANLGIANASYYADTSISRLNRQVNESVQKVAKAKDTVAPGDKVSLSAIDNSFKLDVAAKGAAIKSMSLTQAYLSTAISTLENASAILSEIHSLAVLGANGTNSTEDNAVINMEAEALADAFHKSMTAAEFKGRAIFSDNPLASELAAGGRSNALQFGIGKVDYDFFYDYETPPLATLNAGVKYEIRRELSVDEKDLLRARMPYLTDDMLVPGFQFTTPQAQNNIGEGSIDYVRSGQSATYNRGAGDLQVDPTASATVQGDFRGGSLDIAVSSNFEAADRLTLKDINTASGDSIKIDGNNVISFTFDDPNDVPDQGKITVAIGEIDTTDNGTKGLLKINLYGDATTPGSGNLLNGDFKLGTRDQFGQPYEKYSDSGFEHRDGMVNTHVITNAGNGDYVDAGDAFSTAASLTRGSNTYSINFEGGTGTGFRANVIVDGAGNLSIDKVLDKGKNYTAGDVLTIKQDARGTGLQGTGFAIRVTGIQNANDSDPGRNDANIHEVTTPTFKTTDVKVMNTVRVQEAWGQIFEAGTAKMVATGDNTGTDTNYFHQADGNYAVNAVTVGGVVKPVWTGVYKNDDPTDVLIVDFNPTFTADAGSNPPKPDKILERVTVPDVVNNTGGKNNGTETAIYSKNPDGSRVTTNWTYAEYQAGLADGSITSQGVADTRNTVNRGNILVGAYDGGGAQYIDTPKYASTQRIEVAGYVAPNPNTDITVHNKHTAPGFYAWGGGAYDAGDTVLDPTGNDTTRARRHGQDGTYTWNIAGTDFLAKGGSLDYKKNDTELEYVAWDGSFDPDNPPAGHTVYRTANELATPTFYTRSTGNVSFSKSISHYERPIVTSYDRVEITGYSRDEIAFYTREEKLKIKEANAGTTQEYTGERRITNNLDGSVIRAHVGWDRDKQVFINNWTTYDDRVEFGKTFDIKDTKNGTLIQSGPDGNWVDGTITRSIPTPKVEDMAQPDYGAFVTMAGAPGNPNIQNKDDAASVPVVQKDGADVRDYSDASTPNVPVGLVSGASVVEPFADNVMELFTGEIDFQNNAAFGTYHGPAVVSDQFRAEKGQFLRLNYTAAGDVDNYNVAGYIYEVDAVTGNPIKDANGDDKIIMALSETGDVQLNGRASVEITEGGDYRFVFIVGTFDKTGGLAAGASMRIDNIVAEFPYSISEEAVSAMLQSVHYRNDSTVSSGSKTITTTLRNSDDSHLLTDDGMINLTGFTTTNQSDGPYMLAPTLNLVSTPSDGAANNPHVLTSKIEAVQQSLNVARVQAGSQYSAIENAIESTTDLRSQFALGSGTLSDLNFSLETVNLTRRQMQQDVATKVLAQANKTQSSLVSLVDGSYRTYLNGQFSHLK